MFPRDIIRKTFTVMHYPVLEHKDTLSFAFLVCIVLYIDGKQFACSVFTFVQYMNQRDYFKAVLGDIQPIARYIQLYV